MCWLHLGFMHTLCLAALTTLITTAIAADTCPFTLTPDYDLPVVADGWSYRLVATGFSRPRSLLFDSAGALLVVDAGVGIVRLELDDHGDTCLAVKGKEIILKSQDLNHGIELSEDGNTLYASSAEAVYSWPYDTRNGSVGDTNKTLIANMSNSDHTTRTLLLYRKSPGTLLVSRGSDSNQDGAARELASGHSQLKAFEIEPPNGQNLPYDFPSSGSLLGWGLRNSVGIAEHPVTGGIFTVENSVDELSRDGVDIHQNNPGEELNFHGTLGQSGPAQGGNYGYPDCYALWTTEQFPDLDNLQTGDQFAANSSNDSMCREKSISPRLTFQAHMAPLDILFTGDGRQAFVTFHGSWNRDEPTGYKLSVIDFESGQPQASSNSTDSTRDILTNRNTSACPNKCFRPVGLAWDRSGRLWMSSDSTGEIYILAQASTTSNGTSPTSFAVESTPHPGFTSLAVALTALLPLFAIWL